ncbi:hypothetical protein BXZ70DRAFT_965721 [Cristinia sonorae]|uniref:Uncharacterized protein n=1 Tax=Cristinia sonorae TaxID=1940300 RepID=A0A8K0XU73_9AGAR|nr:hypothetical protein BXZ70DRAFT_965721 [Cristinia sonorae]
MGNTQWTPAEDDYTLNLERNFLAGDLICGVGYGIQLVLWTHCATYLWQHRKSNRNHIYLLAYISLLLTIETMFVIVQGKTVQDIYIDNRNYPGGPWKYFLDTQYLAINVMFYATFFVLTFLSDLLVLWRCWVIWAASGRATASLVTFFPALMTLGSFVMGTLWTLQSSQPTLSMYSKLPMAYGTSYYAISLSVNIILTLLIIVRLIMYRREIAKSLPADYASHYTSLAALFVESAALYTLFAILFLITYAIDNPTNQVFLGMAAAAQQIAAYLIIYRLANGTAFGTNTMSGATLTSVVEINTRGMFTSNIGLGARTTGNFAGEPKLEVTEQENVDGQRQPYDSDTPSRNAV